MRRFFASRDEWHRAFLVLVAVLVVVVLSTFADYGVSWDDEYSRVHGADFIRWVMSGFQDQAVLSQAANEYIYGAVFHGPAAAFAAVSPFRPYESIHLLIALTGCLGVVLTYRIAALLGNSRAGFLAALFLVLTPSWYGHSFINPKDLPFAVAYLAGILSLLRLYEKLPSPGTKRVLATGVILGLAMGIRVGGLILLGLSALMIGLWNLAEYRTRGFQSKTLLQTAYVFIGVSIAAWAMMLLWWPFALESPIANPIYALAKSTQFDGAGFLNLFRGEFIKSSDLPREYLPVWLLVTLPETYGLGVVCGLCALAYSRIRRKTGDYSRSLHRSTRNWFLVVAALFPLIAAVILRPTVYDGTRLFLFVIPPMAILAGLGVSRSLELLPGNALRALLIVALGMLAFPVVMDMARLHPYQYVYFNRSFGGLAKAFGVFETEYWGTSYKEGVEWLARHYRLDAPPRSIGVANPTNPFQTAYYVESEDPAVGRFRHAAMSENPAVILTLTRWNQHLIHGGRILHVVQRMDTPLLYVFEALPSNPATDSIMKKGLSHLHVESNPVSAIAEFEQVLKSNPAHYGASVSLASALQRAGRHSDAVIAWRRVYPAAISAGDTRMVQEAIAGVSSSRAEQHAADK